ncbi:MAG: hypothetical protein QM817_32755 [Archangium sp.]
MERALHQALARWRTCRCEQLALNIDSLHDHLVRTRPQPASSRELSSLLSSLPAATHHAFGAHLDALRAFAPDPRVAQALRLALENEDSLAAPAHRATWRRAFATLASIGDPRARGWLPPLVQAQRGGTTASRHWLRQETQQLCGALPTATPSDVLPVELPKTPPLESLSDAERLVTADWLNEFGDPRGEFLVLQHRGALLPTEKRRLGRLLRDYGRRWLGPLSRALRNDGLRFEKGVVVECRLSGERAAEFTGHSFWRSVRVIDLRALQWNVSLPRVVGFLSHAVMSGLRELRGVPLPILTALLERRMPWRLERLEILGYGAFEPQFLEWFPPFAKLTHCNVNGQRWQRVGTNWELSR